MIEIPPTLSGKQPVNDGWRRLSDGERALNRRQELQGLAEDIRHYGGWMHSQAVARVGHLYPPVGVTAEMAEDQPELRALVGKNIPVIAWLWARTVKSPNPAFRHVDVPLASTFILSNKEGKEAYVYPVVEGDNYTFAMRVGEIPTAAKNGTKLARGANFFCLLSGTPIEPSYIYSEANAGRMGAKLMAIVAEGPRRRVYLPPTAEHESVAHQANPGWKPDLAMPNNPRWFSPPLYGLKKYGDIFTDRQLVGLTSLTDLIADVREKVRYDALAVGFADDSSGDRGDDGSALAYAEAVALYLAFAIDRCADFSNTCTRWVPGNQKVMNLFGKQAIGMTWDFPEAAILHDTVGGFIPAVNFIADCILKLPGKGTGVALQQDAMSGGPGMTVISTDPPYYDNIGYADLSDFFYVWLRRALKPIFPALFSTLAVPKAEELVATPYRHGSKAKAEECFLDGMTQAMANLATQAHPSIPITIYYAFKQSESTLEEGTTSAGWETFLEAVMRAGFVLTGTWPLRSEQEFRMIGIGTNALASSIILVCRARPSNAPTISRRTFQRELNKILPQALDEMTKGAGTNQSPVAPVDLSQAIIGPGMAVFSKYAAVLEADGSRMSVKTALSLINRFLAEDDFDHDTQFCLRWFEQNGWQEGRFGDADTLARAKGTSVEGVKHAGVLISAGGVVRLLKWAEYSEEWDPETDTRLPIWEALHHLIRVFKSDGESGAAKILAAIQAKTEATRQLAYRLYTLCERAGWAEDARAYNEIITSWTAIEAAVARVPGPKQSTLFEH